MPGGGGEASSLARAGPLRSSHGKKSRGKKHSSEVLLLPNDHAEPWDLISMCGFELAVDTAPSRTLPFMLHLGCPMRQTKVLLIRAMCIEDFDSGSLDHFLCVQFLALSYTSLKWQKGDCDSTWFVKELR